MSGYLEVKYPFRSNPFKSWKRQWCILRPSPTCTGGGSLAVYCSEAGAPAGTVELPADSIVRRAKSRTRPNAFAVFSIDEPRKPRILLAAQSLTEANNWMEKIRTLLDSNKLIGTDSLLKDSYSVTVIPTELSRKCGLNCDSVLTVSSSGLLVSRAHKLGTVVVWKHINEVLLDSENADKNRTCVLTLDSDFTNGGGELKFSSPLAAELVAALKQGLADSRPARVAKKLSKSEGDLRSPKCSDPDIGEVRRSSWYSGPSEVSLDDLDLVMSKESNRIPSGQLSRCSGAGDLGPSSVARSALLLHTCAIQSLTSLDDNMSDRRSIASVASGIYEEIAEVPAEGGAPADEPTYESVAECVYATMRRAPRRVPPPPLPPRLPFGPSKLGESWNCRVQSGSAVTRHGSLGSLPRCCSLSSGSEASSAASGCEGRLLPSTAKTLPKFDKTRQPFSVFRKRLKSDSRLGSSPKSDTSKENKDVETKKKRFDFTPKRDIFKSFKVSRKMKNLKITSGALAKGETKSCEFLDETEHVQANRCSKSVECLEDSDKFLDDFEADLSIEFNDDTVAALALPQEIVDLILRGRDQFAKIRLKDTPVEGDYLPMSPIVPPPPIEHQYMVMSPRTNLA
ncbi:uncharacterized protein LOC131851160 [Achroia grisella]|uniref:uncharacterized protein LOC131851160 n=1 Tax=Achroia grisella TaxID=688607 RepID=UPI0027D27899|nr:uncharacterized protein LOC131851160 [Achroia grisella]